MRPIRLFHGVSFGLCLWYLLSYVLQPFPANGIAAVLIALLAALACRHPEQGAITAIFLTPLTLSLGRHLTIYLGDNAPPYLPYAEIVLISVLWGWTWKVVLGDIAPKRFPLAPKARTPAERLLLGIFGLWAILAVTGIFPALYRNLATSPPIPLPLLAVKLAFAPVWGMADEFFPLTVALRVLLALSFVYFGQRLIDQEWVLPRLIRAFCYSMAAVVVYAIIQAAFGVGYSKGGNPAYYIQSTFHENEAFASFCLVALAMTAGQTPQGRFSLSSLFRILLSGLYILGILLSASRAVMILGVVLGVAYLGLKVWKEPVALRRQWQWGLAALVFVSLIWASASALSPRVTDKIERLTNDLAVTQQYFTEEDYKSPGSSLTLVARFKLWQAALNMFKDSFGAGMGTGTYYRLTGFPLYQAIPIMENNHFYWLQLPSELGWPALGVAGGLLMIPLWLWSNGSVALRGISLGLITFWFCNGVGQSLLQQEILWLFALLLGTGLAGPLPRFLADGLTRLAKPAALFLLAGFMLISQGTLWALSLTEARLAGLGIQNTLSETYGYGFDDNGHRFLLAGRILREKIYMSSSPATVEFRLRSALETVRPDNPQYVKVNIVDSYNRIVAGGGVNLTSPDRIESLFVTVPGHEGEILNVLILPEKVAWQGNFLRSPSRHAAGIRYYGFRHVYPEKP